MMKYSSLAITLASALTLAACQQAPSEQAPQPEQTDSPTAQEASPPTGETGSEGTAVAIPAALQGRWGLVPADCTSTRGDAKGLIEIGSQAIKFYESVGTLQSVASSSATSVRGEFAFNGEGMTWSKDMQLSFDAEGPTVTRTEYGADAISEPLTYTGCPK